MMDVLSECGYQWSQSLAQWEPSAARWASAGHELSIATWNVWFGEYGFEERSGALLTEIEKLRPDIIGLQEVTPRLLRIIAQCKWVRKMYTLSEVRPGAMGDYGCLLLSRIPLRGVRKIALPSEMNRYALVTDIVSDNGTFTLVTIHLESTKSGHVVRGQQLQKLFDELEKVSPVVILGDFNFCSTDREENARLDSRYFDLWPMLRPDEPGFTEDTVINSMRLAQTGKGKQVRYDRILLRDDSDQWRACSIELLGTKELEPELFVSDHFGLIAKLERFEMS